MIPGFSSLALSLLAEAPRTAASADEIGLSHYLVVSALVFGLGIMVIIVRRNAFQALSRLHERQGRLWYGPEREAGEA